METKTQKIKNPLLIVFEFLRIFSMKMARKTKGLQAITNTFLSSLTYPILKKCYFRLFPLKKTNFIPSSCLTVVILALITPNLVATDEGTGTLSPPTGFCQARTYDTAITCSGNTFVAETLENLNDYNTRLGLVDGEYKKLIIMFPLTGETIQAHSPCDITVRSGMTHTAVNICLSSKGKLKIKQNSIFNSGKIHILPQGDLSIDRSARLMGTELEIFSSGKVHVNNGVRLDFSGNTRIISTATNQRIRFGPGSQVTSDSLTVIGHEIINFTDTLVTSTGDITIESRGTESRNRVGFFKNTSLRGRNVTIRGGNQIIAKSMTRFRASGNLHAEALSCNLYDGVSLEGSTSSGSCVGTTFNQIPSAIITASPRTGDVPFTTSFDASLSSDPDGTIESYSWEFPDGTTLTGSRVSREFTQAGSYTVKLIVTDDDGASEEAEVVINAQRVLVSPTASASYTPQSGDAPLTVSFDGSGSSDPDGDIVTYEWLFTDGETLSGETAQRTFDRAGQYRFSLRVTDADNLTHQTGEFVINVAEPNNPPVMVGDQTFEVKENKVMNISLNGATDPDGNIITYEVVNSPSSGTLTECLGGTNDLNCVYTPASDFTGTVIFSYRANDGRRDSETVSMVTLNVISYNKRPIANAGSDENALSGTMVTLDGAGSSDPENEPLTYLWELSGKPFLSRAQLANSNSVTPGFIVDKDGTYTARLIVNDGKLDSAPDEVSITVTGETNTPPVLNSITTPQNIPIGTELRFTISGSDANTQDQIRFSSPNLPANASLNGGTGEFRFTPTLSQVGPHAVTFQVTDGKDITSQGVMFLVQPAAENQVTVLSSRVIDANAFSGGQTVPLAGVRVGVVGSTVSTTTDSQGRFTLSGLPSGSQIITLDASSVAGSIRYANFNGRINIMENVLNRPLRDYMLPRMSSGTTVSPAQTTTVSNTNIGVTLTIPPNTAMNADGTMYSGPLSIDMVPTDATPRELPEEFQPSFIITIQPTGVRFANPVPITFPNTDNLPAGTIVELFSLSERGGFESVGYGRVSSDGQSITTVTGGVRSASWHFPAPASPTFTGGGGPGDSNGGTNNGGGGGDGGGPPSTCDGSILCVVTGSLSEEHELPAFISKGVPVAMKMGFKNPPSLQFGSTQATFTYRGIPLGGIDTITQPAPRMTLSVSIGGVTSVGTSFDARYLLRFPRQPFDLVKHVDTRGMATGIYPMETSILLGATFNLSSSSRVMKIDTDYPVINPETEFGTGWRFEGLQKLYGIENDPVSSTSRKIMLVYGNFKYLVFERNEDGTYTSPRGDYSTLSFIPEPFGGYSRTTKDGTNYLFDRTGKLVGSLDRYQRRTTYSYNTNNRLTQITHSSGGNTLFIYGTDGYIDTITDPMMRVTRFSHDSSGHLLQIIDPDNTTRTFEYGADHRLLSQLDKLGRAKNYGYDSAGNVVQVIRPDNTQVEMISKGTKLTKIGSNSVMVVLDDGTKYSSFVDAKGNTTEMETNAFGSSMRTVDPMNQITSHTRDENNNITSSTDKRGNRYTRAYDSMGNLTSFTENSINRSYSYRYMANPAENYHQMTSSTDGKGNSTTYQYDRLGNLTKVIAPHSRISQFTYNGYLLTSASRLEDPVSPIHHFEYDTNGNPIVIRDTRRAVIARMTYDSAGNTLTRDDGLGNVTTYTYDSMNRLLTQTDTRNGIIRYAYDFMGNLTSITDERNHITSFEYDKMNRLVKITDPRLCTEEFEYDANGNLIERTDKNENTIISQYDVLDRLTSKIFPDRTTYSFTYDANNNLLTATDSDSDLSFTYDNSDRLTQASTANNRTVPNVDVTYTYDNNDNVTVVHDSVTSSIRQILYDYDNSDRLTRMGHSSPTDLSSIRFTYNKLDQRTGTLYSNGVTTSYTYNLGKPNQLRQLAHQKITTPVNPPGETVTTTHSSFTYFYNLNDYVTSLTTTRSEITVNSPLTYLYDTTNQLTSVTKPQGTGTETFTYDLSGNRLRRDGETTDSTYSTKNELTNDKTYTYVYDRNGNLTERTHTTTGEITTYTWDYENQLTSVTKKPNATAEPTSEVTYKYDALGRRIQKNVHDTITITNYVYDRDNILLEFNAQNILEAKYIHSDQVDEVMVMERPRSPHTDESFPAQKYYYHHDRLGSVTEVTNLIGDVVQRYVYDSFGNTSIYNKDGTAITESSTDYLKTPYTFTGRERDSETGLHYHRARYYNPTTGRWISSDPTEFESGDSNFYRYVFNNSINFNDPDGERVGLIKVIVSIGFYLHGTFCGAHREVCGLPPKVPKPPKPPPKPNTPHCDPSRQSCPSPPNNDPPICKG